MRPVLTAILSLALPDLGKAQIGPGQALVGTTSGLFAAEPLNGALQTLPWSLFPPADVRAAALGPTASTIFVGTTAPARLYSAVLGGSTLSNTQLISSALGNGDVRRILPVSSTNVLVATTTSIYTVAPSQAPVLVAPASTGTVVDACVIRPGSGLAWIVDQGSSVTLHLRNAAQPSVSAPLTVTSPTALLHLPALGGFVVSTATGRLLFVDSRSFAARTWGQAGHAITAMAPHQSRTAVMVAGAGQLSVIDSGTTIYQNPLSTTGPVTSLDFEPESSTFATFGTACPTSQGQLPGIGATDSPYPGNRAFSVTCANVPAGRFAFLVLGFQRTALPLAGFGIPGCTLWVDPFQTFSAVTTPIGTTARPLPIPADPALRGSLGFVQWAVVDPLVNATGFTFSDGGILSI